MTTSTGSTSSDVKEIQDRNAAARGRVIAKAADQSRLTHEVDKDDLSAVIEAAMMELAAVWREEAAHVTAAKRKGHVSIAKEYTMAASRLAGFAVGLITRPVLESSETVPAEMTGSGPMFSGQVGYRKGEHGRPMAPCYECLAFDEDPSPWCDCTHDDGRACKGPCRLEAHSYTFHPQGCTHYARTTNPDPSHCMYCHADLEQDPVAEIVAALPEGDPVAAVFSSPMLDAATCAHPADASSTLKDGSTRCTLCGLTTRPLIDDTSEEENLRDIIGPLGASSVTATVDHPFTNPGVPWLNQRRAVEVVPYAQLPVIAAALAPRDHVSHSYVESYEGCSLSAMLRDASKAGHVGAARPSWSQIGGKTFHSAVELIERLALSGVSTADDPEALWAQHFDAAVKEQLDALVGTPYADSATWYISNRGKEGFDWWRVEGAKMLGLYVKHHTPQWRASNPTFLLADTTPVIELPYTMSIRSLDEVRGLTAQGFIDRATLNLTTYSLTVLDYKTGSRDPESTFQLGEYGHALLMAMGIAAEPADRPILGQYWLARKGIYTDPVPVVTRHPLAELQYRYDAAARGTAAKVFAPHATNLCKSCSVTDYCPTQAGRS